jgi:Sec-independent protein translocase protein TatA
MRILDIIVIAGIMLALFGPKTLQVLARNAGKTTGGVKSAKDKFMAHEDVSAVHDTLNKIPTSPQRAFQMAMSSDQPKAEAEAVDRHRVESVPPVETVPKHS